MPSKLGWMPADQADLGRPVRPRLLRPLDDVVDRQQVRVVAELEALRAAREPAEPAAEVALVGVVDVAVDDVADRRRRTGARAVRQRRPRSRRPPRRARREQQCDLGLASAGVPSSGTGQNRDDLRPVRPVSAAADRARPGVIRPIRRRTAPRAPGPPCRGPAPTRNAGARPPDPSVWLHHARNSVADSTSRIRRCRRATGQRGALDQQVPDQGVAQPPDARRRSTLRAPRSSELRRRPPPAPAQAWRHRPRSPTARAGRSTSPATAADVVRLGPHPGRPGSDGRVEHVALRADVAHGDPAPSTPRVVQSDRLRGVDEPGVTVGRRAGDDQQSRSQTAAAGTAASPWTVHVVAPVASGRERRGLSASAASCGRTTEGDDHEGTCTSAGLGVELRVDEGLHARATKPGRSMYSG